MLTILWALTSLNASCNRNMRNYKWWYIIKAIKNFLWFKFQVSNSWLIACDFLETPSASFMLSTHKILSHAIIIKLWNPFKKPHKTTKGFPSLILTTTKNFFIYFVTWHAILLVFFLSMDFLKLHYFGKVFRKLINCMNNLICWKKYREKNMFYGITLKW